MRWVSSWKRCSRSSRIMWSPFSFSCSVGGKGGKEKQVPRPAGPGFGMTACAVRCAALERGAGGITNLGFEFSEDGGKAATVRVLA